VFPDYVHLPDAHGIARNASAHQLNKRKVDYSLKLCLRTSYEPMLSPYDGCNPWQLLVPKEPHLRGPAFGISVAILAALAAVVVTWYTFNVPEPISEMVWSG